MELRGLFQYLVNQLKKGNGSELVLLQELIQQMANVQYTENMTEEQLDAMAGSDTLRYQATSFGVTRNNKALIKSTNRLRDALLPKDEPKLAIPLLLLLAQHRSVVVIDADVPHIKMVSEQFDRCHGTLLQYVEFLTGAMSTAAAYALHIPSLNDLIHLYHLDPEVAFLIYRPVMRLFRCQSNSDIFWPLDCEEVTITSTTGQESEPTETSGKLVLDLASSQKPIMWTDLLGTVRTMLPSKAWNSLSPDLYATFWGLTLYDLYVPRSRYEAEIAKQHAALKALEELSDNSNSAITKRKKDKERIQESLDRLTSELHKHEQNVASVRKRLAREKDRWLSSCPDTLKINMEFLQRCIFPRCTFSMPDAVYCAMFVHTLHSLGTPFFNTVNHIDVLICKTLQPMICCCTEYEVGRLGKFLYETLKTAYYWKSDESIYERECGNMPGFAVYYRYPNSQRVTYGQFIKVHWKWSQRITRLLIQCLESAEYMDIRNALILLTKISNVFPVTRKSGINLEKRVAKIKSDEREDLKVLATGVAAALAARKPSWVTEEEFGMGYLELKPAQPSHTSKSLASTLVAPNNGSAVNPPHNDAVSVQVVKDHPTRTKPADGRQERVGSASLKPSDAENVKAKGVSTISGSDSAMPVAPTQSGLSRSVDNQKHIEESANRSSDDNAKGAAKTSADNEGRAAVKRSVPAGSLSKQAKQDLGKDETKAKAVGRASGSVPAGDLPHHLENRQALVGNGNSVSAASKSSIMSGRPSDIHGTEMKSESGISKSSDSRVSSGKDDGTDVSDMHKHSSSRLVHSPKHDNSFSKSGDKLPKRASPAEELDRLSKRRKGEYDSRDLEAEVRLSDRERSADARVSDKIHPADHDKLGSDEQQISSRTIDRSTDKLKEKVSERYDREYREKSDRPDKPRGDDVYLLEKTRERSVERYVRARSVDRLQERSSDRVPEKAKEDRIKDDRSKVRHNEISTEKSHPDDRFHVQSLPPPPPLPPHVVPQSLNARREEDDRRFGAARNTQRLSPRHEERERRRSEENMLVSPEDAKRRREDEFRERKREERDILSIKMEERERDRDREKVNLKEEIDANLSKRRKLKRDHLTAEAGEFLPATSPSPASVPMSMMQPYDGRERGDRKANILQRPTYVEEPSGLRLHGKDAPGKMTRRDTDPMYDREWEDEKRQRADPKRRHRK